MRVTTWLLMAHVNQIDLAELIESFLLGDCVNGKYTYSGVGTHTEVMHDCLRDAKRWGRYAEVNRMLADACFLGDVDLIELILAHGATQYTRALASAAMKGNLCAVRRMIGLGAELHDYGILDDLFARFDEKTVYELLTCSRQPCIGNIGLIAIAAKNNNRTVLDICCPRSGDEIDCVVMYAAENGHASLTLEYVELGGSERRAFAYAICSGHINVVGLLLARDGRQITPNELMILACEAREYAIIETLIWFGATSCKCGRPIHHHVDPDA